ncbi:MAG TPA: pentapeptide repeat-containing protein [Chloroflexia bacterium]|nr:pentapeptide repeat-containing protein [Chloroflexia bacterium]
MAKYPPNQKPWWRSTRLRIGVILAVAVGFIILGYWLPYPWIGFNSQETPKPVDVDYRPMKTVWDWLGLLIIPAALGVGGLLFSSTERKADREIAKERAENDQKIADERIRDSILREYLDRMSVLLIEHNLATSEIDSPVRYVARARTLTLLNALVRDGERKGSVIQFLYEAGLINKEASVVRLAGANLSDAKLIGATLSGANLRSVYMSGAYLSSANLTGATLSGSYMSGAYLSSADLSDADLSGASLGRAYLRGANLNRANLREASLFEAHLEGADLRMANLTGTHLEGANLQDSIVTGEQLDEAKSLRKATMPDGSKHE